MALPQQNPSPSVDDKDYNFEVNEEDEPATLVRSRAGGTTTLDDGQDAVVNDDDDSIVDRTKIPWAYRGVAFVLILFFSTGSSFAEGAIPPLKTRLVKKLGITNAQYGTISSADAFVNTILPIIGGLAMDYYGATYAAIVSTILILTGAVVSASSAHTNSYGTLVGGRIIMGLGSTVIESCQNKLYAHWFAGSTLGMVIGIDIAWNRIISIATKASAVPLANINDFYGWAFWVPAMVCGLNLTVVVIYWIFERRVPKEFRPVLGRNARLKEGSLRKPVRFNMLWRLPKFFWILCITQLFQNAAVGTYNSNLADIQVKTRGTKELAAGYNSALQGVVPIVLTPLAGLFFDVYGWRTAFISWTALLYIIVFVLIGLTTVHPLVPILISSFALSTNALTFNAMIPVLVGTERLMGTAFGVWRAFQNCNSLILEVAAGAIQDRSPNKSYDNFIFFLIAIKCVEFCLGPIYQYLDKIWLGNSLRSPEKRRVMIWREAVLNKVPYEGWRIAKYVRLWGLVQLTCMIITGWTLYIVYSLGT